MSSATQPTLGSLTPVLVVDQVEPCLSFWVDRLGFTPENQVPGDDGRLVFASVIADRPDAAAELTGHSTGLFITTQDLDAVERALEGAPVVQPRHTTFYGSTEIYVREPGGNTVGFAQFS